MSAADPNNDKKDLLFKATCPGCQAKIKIRDPQFVGRRIVCPTCQTKFVVEPPVGFALPKSASSPPQSIKIPAPSAPKPVVAKPITPVSPTRPAPPVGKPADKKPRDNRTTAGHGSASYEVAKPLPRAPVGQAQRNPPPTQQIPRPSMLQVANRQATTKPKSGNLFIPALIAVGGIGLSALILLVYVTWPSTPRVADIAPESSSHEAHMSPLATAETAAPVARGVVIPPPTEPVPTTTPAPAPMAPPIVPASTPSTAAASAVPTSTAPGATRAVIDRVGPGIVLITTFDSADNRTGLGSGFLIDPSGRVATNFHVVENAVRAVAQFKDGKEIPLTGYWIADEPHDLAVLQLQQTPPLTSVLTLAKNAAPQQGDDVIAIGHPKGFNFSVSTGIVSAVRTPADLPDEARQWLEAPDDTMWIQTTAPIAPGNSGGPLLNAQGEVIGINTWVSAGGGNLAFATHVKLLENCLSGLSSSAHPFPMPGSKSTTTTTKNPELAKLAQQFTSDYKDYLARIEGAGVVERGRLESQNPAVIYMEKCFQLADKHRREPVALEALLVVCDLAQLDNRGAANQWLTATTERLIADYTKEEKVADGAILLARAKASGITLKFFEHFCHRSPHREVQGIAKFCRLLHTAELASSQPSPGVEAHVLGMLSEIEQKYADVPFGKITLGECARLMRVEIDKRVAEQQARGNQPQTAPDDPPEMDRGRRDRRRGAPFGRDFPGQIGPGYQPGSPRGPRYLPRPGMGQ